MLIHTVLRGESLYSIARDYGVNPVQMAAENGFSMEEPLVVGQTVVVQFPKTVHIVREGETLSAVAQLYGVSMITLQRNDRWLEGAAFFGRDRFGDRVFQRAAGPVFCGRIRLQHH